MDAAKRRALMVAPSMLAVGLLLLPASYWLAEDFNDHRPRENGCLGERWFYAALTWLGPLAFDNKWQHRVADSFPEWSDTFVPRSVGLVVLAVSMGLLFGGSLLAKRHSDQVLGVSLIVVLLLGGWLFMGFMLAAGKSV